MYPYNLPPGTPPHTKIFLVYAFGFGITPFIYMGGMKLVENIKNNRTNELHSFGCECNDCVKKKINKIFI